MDYNRIARKMEDLIKKSIKDYGLIDTGAMYDSIEVTVNASGYEISAVEYFKYHNSDYNIVKDVVESNEFISFMEDMFVEDINKDI